jgi:pyruvate-ferredoxin/flavodoxin oxidoreductase
MYRFNPELRERGQDPFTWDSPDVDTDFEKYVEEEIRYRSLMRANPEEAYRLIDLARKDNKRRFEDIKHLAEGEHKEELAKNKEKETIHD